MGERHTFSTVEVEVLAMRDVHERKRVDGKYVDMLSREVLNTLREKITGKSLDALEPMLTDRIGFLARFAACEPGATLVRVASRIDGEPQTAVVYTTAAVESGTFDFSEILPGGPLSTDDDFTLPAPMHSDECYCSDCLAEAAEAVAEDDEPPLSRCPACGSLNYSIGQLGKLAHFSCRSCGLSYSNESEES